MKCSQPATDWQDTIHSDLAFAQHGEPVAQIVRYKPEDRWPHHITVKLSRNGQTHADSGIVAIDSLQPTLRT